MFEDKFYRLYGVFGPEDKIVAAFAEKRAAIDDAFERNKAAAKETGLRIDQLDDVGYVVGEIGFDQHEVNFLGIADECEAVAEDPVKFREGQRLMAAGRELCQNYFYRPDPKIYHWEPNPAKKADWDKGNEMQVRGREISKAACKRYAEIME